MSRLSSLLPIGCFLFFLSFTISVRAQEEAATFNVDSTLYAYYQRCQECLIQPVVLQMADTLFNMAAEKGDKRMQAVALSTQLDYYYFQARSEDSVIHYTNKVKLFSKATQQPKYYYFSWANRLIPYYLKTGRPNIALYEAQKMLKEAQEEDNKTGLTSCYSVMSQIYTVKNLKEMALEWRLKEIELFEKYKQENYNIAHTYTQIADYYINHKEQEKALEALEKAIKTSNSITQKMTAELEFVNYYCTFDDLKSAERILKECQAAFENDKRLNSIKKRLYNTECFYYKQTKQYQKAMEAALNQEKEERSFNENAMSAQQYRVRAEIYKLMGNLNEATKYMQMYVEADDSLKIANERLASSEFATLLNVEKLNAEKKELILRAQKKELHTKTMLIISLVVLLAIVFFFLYRENRLNRKLKISEGELKIRNEELTVSREELRKARDLAEASSRMKTTFIQSMSHEIRTPLNSIVGFSQVLNDLYGDKFPESQEFVNIIKANSNNLLRLVTDVLALSELDQYDKLPTDSETDINMICYLASEIANDNKQEGVEIIFKPTREHLVIISNSDRVSQVLNCLAHNATKFTSQGSISIDYTVLEDEKKIEISVTDTGIGIPLNKQKAVFERFYKINTFTQGTGLGLPICRSIAEKLGGSLHIDTSYTNGCRVVLTLPLVYA